MVTHVIKHYKIDPVWDNQYQTLQYANEQFNDQDMLWKWYCAGYPNKFTGDMCDMRNPQPTWNDQIINYFAKKGWLDVGTSYYRMGSGTILPTHEDLYLRYIELHNLKGKEQHIRRAVIFLEDWQPGHYAEYLDKPFVEWSAGDVVEWTYNAPHMAANMGRTPRYTLQITGHVQ
jgi:hypothetical protein